MIKLHILLGTEIPPLVFFKTDQGKIEVIDGRQRYETLSKFLGSNLSLSKKGLTNLKSLHKKKYADLEPKIQDIYLDTKIRIIEFSIVNEPKLTDRQEDLIKKEIFRRYNSGITPLTSVDINRAMYNNDNITNFFKTKIRDDEALYQELIGLFFNSNSNRKVSVDTIMHKIRQILVLHKIPVKYYSRSSNRQFVIESFYEILMNETEDPSIIYNDFIRKIELLIKLKGIFCKYEIEYNKLISECLIWALYICDVENIDIPQFEAEEPFYNDLLIYVKQDLDKFSNLESHFYKSYEPRYEYILKFVENKFNKNLVDTYITSHRDVVKNRQKIDSDINITKQLDELKELRIDKAEPSSTTIEDLSSQMLRKRFLVRPSYQREEVINLVKSSSIIESILLDIKLPPIFIFKRKDGVSEVIDGQQRLLTILGYMGEGFCDERGNSIYSKKNQFKLKDLRVLDELNGLRFNSLDSKLQDKIYDFNLSVVTIDEERNPNFNPIDLFIRLNNKPYPVRENTFEMWNSYIDKEIITKIRTNVKKNEEWMYFRKNNSRMINEEMYTILSYLSYKNNYENIKEKDIFDIYQKGQRINFRIQNKKDLTRILESASKDNGSKKHFLASIRNVESFIKKLRLILVTENISNDTINEYLKNELNLIFKVKANSTRRSLQDFYALWYIIQPLNIEMIRRNREVIKEELQIIFTFMKEIPENSLSDFLNRVNEFNEKYKINQRKLKLPVDKVEEIIKRQNFICPICKEKLYIGDITNNDHIVALAIGGDDEIENIQVTHESCNHEKGCKQLELI
ncbi:GmrSD restriction endonuclease domain-containing protein [Clostridium botulinum]|uniref:GmrSD restriction endonuclease domain-containing protein n=1 Tax=Clostridium botulinum TaxID=1491 RepID=UPI003DA6BFE2